MAARALPWRSRRERLLALGRLWRLRLLGARRVLSMGPVHHVHLLLVKKEDKTMRHKMVLAMAGARCRSSACRKTCLAVEYGTVRYAEGPRRLWSLGVSCLHKTPPVAHAPAAFVTAATGVSTNDLLKHAIH